MSSAQSRADRPFGRISVLGLGLMGGSLARGLSELGVATRVTGWSPESTERDAALTSGALSLAAADWREAVVDADLIVLAAPLGASCALLEGLATEAPPWATVSDVVSLKAPIAEVARAVGLADRWVGCHPMTGGTRSGFWASRSDLFSGARVWTVADEAAAERVPAVHSLWAALGARPAEIGAEEHDRLMALASHLPQLVANGLAGVLSEEGVSAAQLGPGGREMTRLAESNPETWRDLLALASPELSEGLRSLADSLVRIADLVDGGELDALDDVMRDTAAWRARP